jgi:hypothetical protein
VLIEVSFKGNRKEFFAWDGPEPPPIRAPVIVEADRGEDLGRVHAVGELAAKRSRGTAHGLGEAASARVASRRRTISGGKPSCASKTRTRDGARPSAYEHTASR